MASVSRRKKRSGRGHGGPAGLPLDCMALNRNARTGGLPGFMDGLGAEEECERGSGLCICVDKETTRRAEVQ